MAANNLGNVVALIKSATAPTKLYVIWAREITPGITINYYYDYALAAWIPLLEGNPFYQKPVKAMASNAPPATPAIGDRYVIGAAPTGAWAGFAQYIASWNGATWDKTPPLQAMQVSSLAAANKLYLFDGSIWNEFSAGDGAALISFNGARPITRAVAGLQGVTPGGTNLVEFNEKVWYPALAPGATVSISGGNVREIGSDANVSLVWAATKTTNNLSAISVNSVPITPVLGPSQNGVLAAVGNVTGNTTFPMSVTAGTVATGQQVTSTSVTLSILPKRFWFVSNQDLMAMTDTAISDLLNALTAANFEYATGKDMAVKTLTPASQYIYTAYTDPDGTLLATHSINNNPFTDWQTKTFSYKNSKNYVSQYRLYRTTNLLNNTFTLDQN